MEETRKDRITGGNLRRIKIRAVYEWEGDVDCGLSELSPDDNVPFTDELKATIRRDYPSPVEWAAEWNMLDDLGYEELVALEVDIEGEPFSERTITVTSVPPDLPSTGKSLQLIPPASVEGAGETDAPRDRAT